MQRLQPKAAKMEVWSHPWTASLNFPVRIERGFSSLGFQTRKVFDRGRKGLNASNWESKWTGALQEDSRKFLQTAIFRPPPPFSMRRYSTVPPFFPLRYNGWLSAVNFIFWQHIFGFSWFFLTRSCKHSGCLCSQWYHKLPTSNSLSMVCDNMRITSPYTNKSNPSKNSEK